MKLDAISLIEEYAVWGGVPRYWTLRERYTSLMEAIDDLVLNSNGVLSAKPEALFMDEVSDIAPYSATMLAVGRGNEHFSNIASALAKKTTELSRPLAALTDMRYIRVVRKEIENELPNLAGRMWEGLCQRAVSGNEIFGHTWDAARRWWGKAPIYQKGRKTPIGSEDIEMDLVAQSLDDPNTLLVAECKWTKSDFADRLLRQLTVKTSKAPFAQGKKIVYALFLREKPLAQFEGNVMFPEDVLRNLP